MKVGIYIVLLSFSSCVLSDTSTSQKQEGEMLASVGDKTLFLNDLDDLVNADNPQDSLIQLNEFINLWIKENVLLVEAERTFPDDVDIDKMVEDYRSSLLLHNYKVKLVEQKLDTIVSQSDVKAYYDEYKNSFLLPDDIVQINFAIIPDDTRGIEQFYKNWQRDKRKKVVEYLEENAVEKLMNDSLWLSTSEVERLYPEGVFKSVNFAKKGDPQQHDGEFEYFLKIIDFKAKGEVAPMRYVEDKIKKVIIHQRKNDILNGIRNKLFDDYLNNNKVRIYTEK